MWSIGCIFAELLQTLEPGVVKPSPLFPGKSCYPFSTSVKHVNVDTLKSEFANKSHQLEKIFEVIGTPPREDLLALDDGPMKDVVVERVRDI